MNREHPSQKAKQKGFYDSFATEYDDFELWRIRGKDNRYRRRFMARRAAIIAGLAHLGPSSVALEVGCGTGNYTGHFVRFARGIRGLDFSRGMLNRAAAKLHREELPLVQADAEHLPFKDSCFDAVISVNALEHLDDIPQALREMNRVARNGGRIVVSIPNDNPAQDVLLRVYARCMLPFLSKRPFKPSQYAPGATHRSLTAGDLLIQFRECGIRFEHRTFMGFVERRMSQMTWAHGIMEVLDKLLERIPMVKSLAGIVIVCGTSSKPENKPAGPTQFR